MAFFLVSLLLSICFQSMNAMNASPKDGMLISGLMGEYLTNVFAQKQRFSAYSVGSVSIDCQEIKADSLEPYKLIKCHANSDELKMSCSLATFKVSRSIQGLAREAPLLSQNACLESLFSDHTHDGRGLPFSPYHQESNHFKLFSYDPVEPYYCALVNGSVLEAFFANPRMFYYLLADRRFDHYQGPGPHFMPAVCTQAILNGHLPNVAAEPVVDTKPLHEMSKPVLVGLETCIDSLTKFQTKHRAENGTSGDFDYFYLLSVLTGRRILDFDTNLPMSLDLIATLKMLAKIVQDMAHMEPSCGNVIDASQILPLVTHHPTVPQTSAAYGNYLCSRMFHSGKVWFSMRNVELGYTGDSTNSFNAFRITDNENLSYIKFRMDEVSRGFYFLLIFQKN